MTSALAEDQRCYTTPRGTIRFSYVGFDHPTSRHAIKVCNRAAILMPFAPRLVDLVDMLLRLVISRVLEAIWLT
jgi:hypothetical protein